jgi:molybdopterin/thiamine biosynthesis adenylyltransferase
MRRLSTAMTGDIAAQLASHLLREDGQEDLCFALYRPSTGSSRETSLLFRLVLPEDGDRRVHGNASFMSSYFLRALDEAEQENAGLALAHSHPLGRSWQGMSPDDVRAEGNIAAQALAVTGLPLIGLTMAGDGQMSARTWERISRAEFARVDHRTVRVVADRLRLTYHPGLAPPPPPDGRMARTVSAWGSDTQADLARLHVGVVGLGSVGMLVAEELVRVGIHELTLIDFDSVKPHNLDRLAHATALDAAMQSAKVEVAAKALARLAPFSGLAIHPNESSAVEAQGFNDLLDCDIVFSCVDRPWPRQVLDNLAFAHLIPVVDGGVLVTALEDTLRHADWKAHIASPARRCLGCIGQYSPADVALERAGDLDDPSYIRGLPEGHPLRANENVFAFAAAVASLEVLQLLSMLVAPLDVADVGEANYHFVTGGMDVTFGRICEHFCPHPAITALGNSAPAVTQRHPAAEAERAARHRHHQRQRVKAARSMHRFASDAAQRVEGRLVQWLQRTA